MPVVFSESKTGASTCSIDGIYLHSKYNPEAEGERFADEINADFSPLCIIILEPALSYCVKRLRQRFPSCTLCAIRFTDDFKESDRLWDFVFYGKDCRFFDLSSDLYNVLGEEKLISSLCLDYLPSRKIFNEASQAAWEEIKKAVLKSRDILGTRKYFSKRWIKNSFQQALKIKNVALPQKTSKPVLIAASGPSLLTSLPFIKENRNKFILIALSSAYKPLLREEIQPDFTISTDGGFWAKKHLYFSGFRNDHSIFALSTEGAFFSKLYENSWIIPLAYEDSFGKKFLQSINCPFIYARRNGSVAGTALELALSLSSSQIFLCGYDQAPSPGMQHVQPNELENRNECSDFRLKTKETRQTASRFNSSASLEIYRNWFISKSESFCSRVSRLSDNYRFANELGAIKDINWKDFSGIMTNLYAERSGVLKMPAPINETERNCINFNQSTLSLTEAERKIKLFDVLEQLKNSEDFQKEVFPLEYLLIKRECNPEKRKVLIDNLQNQTLSFIDELKEMISEVK